MACTWALLASDTSNKLDGRWAQTVALATQLRADQVTKIIFIPNKDDTGCVVLIPDRDKKYSSVIILGKNDLQWWIVGAQIRPDQEIPIEIEPVYELTDEILDTVMDRLIQEKNWAEEKK